MVAPGGQGSGTPEAPLGSIQGAIGAAQAGDRVVVRPGTYREALQSVRPGVEGGTVTVRAAEGPGSVVVTYAGRVLTVNHPHFVVEGLILDGQYGADDTVRVGSAARGFTLRHSEVRRSGFDLVDIGATEHVLIEHARLHHALNAAGGRADAHGIVAGAARDLTIRDSEIHTFSGDGIQIDPGRAAPGWDRVTVERTRIWLAPLTEPIQGFAAGVVPGENGIDTKASPSFPRATLIVRDVELRGFRKGLIDNMAAFNLKEHVDVVVDGATVRDSEIAFRLRGPGTGTRGGARVRIQNTLMYDVDYGLRYEDGIQELRVWNSTMGQGVTHPFWAAGSRSGPMDIRNVLFWGPVPPQATHSSNREGRDRDFVNAAAHDYQLAPGSRAVDGGVAIPDVTTDRLGVPRPQGKGHDVGAFERR